MNQHVDSAKSIDHEPGQPGDLLFPRKIHGQRQGPIAESRGQRSGTFAVTVDDRNGGALCVKCLDDGPANTGSTTRHDSYFSIKIHEYDPLLAWKHLSLRWMFNLPSGQHRREGCVWDQQTLLFRHERSPAADSDWRTRQGSTTRPGPPDDSRRAGSEPRPVPPLDRSGTAIPPDDSEIGEPELKHPCHHAGIAVRPGRTGDAFPRTWMKESAVPEPRTDPALRSNRVSRGPPGQG